MTENEVKELRKELNIDTVSVMAQYQWCKEQLPLAQKAVDDLKSAFNLYQFIRNDERMNAIKADLKQNQSMLEYLQNQIRSYEENIRSL